jgi:hypothetical protein
MELRRRRPNLFWLAFFLLGGLVIIWASQNGWEMRLLFVPLGSTALLIVGLISVLGALAVLASSFRPTPIVVSESGLRLRVAGIDRSVPWTSIDALILEPYQATPDTLPAPRLLLVPSADANLGKVAEYQNKVDGRLSIILLELDSLRAPQGQVIQALATYAGQRFINGVPNSAVDFPGSPA